MSELLRYRRERLPLRLVLTVSLLLAAAAAIAVSSYGWTALLWNLVLAALMFVQFRIWDDLADIERDRDEFPGRVLCNVSQRTPFWFAVVGFFMTAGLGILCLKSQVSAITFGALNMLFLLWYHAIRRFFGRLLNVIAVLAKYPAFVFVIADAPIQYRARTATIVSVVYVGACLYEVLHNKR